MSAWNDFNDAEQQSTYELIPKGTIVNVRMTIKPGGHDDQAHGWTGGYATQSYDTGSVYLACEFVVLDGPFNKRKIWTNIGLYSSKGPNWSNMGRSFIRAALNSARGVHPQDTSPAAAATRRIRGFEELDGLEFIARIDIEKDARGDYRNIVRCAVEPDQADYPKRGQVNAPPQSQNTATPNASGVTTGQQATGHQGFNGRPSWA